MGDRSNEQKNTTMQLIIFVFLVRFIIELISKSVNKEDTK